MQDIRERIIKEVLNRSANGRLTCEEAHAIGGKLGVDLREIGNVCDELKIRISACQLGCF